MPLVLTTYQGAGVKGDAFRPVGIDGLDAWSSLDLRPDPTGPGGLCFAYAETLIKGALIELGDDPKATFSANIRDQISNAYGKTLDLGKLDVETLVATFGAEIGVKPSRGKFEVFCGRLEPWASTPEIKGGAPIDPRRIWLPRHISLNDVEEWMLEPFQVDGETWWTVPIRGGASLATDSFNRADADPISGNWTTFTGESAWAITSNQASVGGFVDNGSYETAVSWPNDQYSQAKATVTTSYNDGSGAGVRVRCAAGARTAYDSIVDASNHAFFSKFVAGAYTSIWSRSITYSAGAVIYLEAQGTTLVTKYNGAAVGASDTDSSIASGKAGIRHSGNTAATTRLDDWEGGDFGGAAASVPAAFVPARPMVQFGPMPLRAPRPIVIRPPVNVYTPVTASVTVTATPTITKAVGKLMEVTATATATVLKSIGKTLGVTSTLTASCAKNAGKVCAATVTGTASIAKSVGKIVAATAALTASMTAIKVFLLTLSVTATGTASVAKSVGKVCAVTATGTASMVRSVVKTLAVTVTKTASMTATKAILITLSATVTATASVTRTIGKILSATRSAIASLVATLQGGGGGPTAVQGTVTLRDKAVADLELHDSAVADVELSDRAVTDLGLEDR